METLRKLRPLFVLVAAVAIVIVYKSFDFSWLSGLSKSINLVASAVAFVLFGAVLAVSCTSGRTKIIKILLQFAKELLIMVVVVAAAAGLTYLHYDWIKWVYLAVLSGFIIWRYFADRHKWGIQHSSSSVRRSAVSSGELKYIFTYLLATLFFAVLCQISLLLMKGNYPVLLIPIASSVLALVLWKVTGWRGWYLLAIVAVVLFLLVYSTSIDTVFNVSELPDASIVTALSLSIILPILDLYTRKEANI